MTLEQLMAFTLTDDHARQEQVWQIISERPYDADARSIRAMLTEETIDSNDRRALFVGLDAYKAAGGTIVSDLFAQDDDCYLEDPALLDRLCTDKLKAAAEVLRPEGWKWIAVAVTFPSGTMRACAVSPAGSRNPLKLNTPSARPCARSSNGW